MKVYDVCVDVVCIVMRLVLKNESLTTSIVKNYKTTWQSASTATRMRTTAMSTTSVRLVRIAVHAKNRA